MKERSDELLMIFSMIMCGCLFVNKLDGMHIKAIFCSNWQILQVSQYLFVRMPNSERNVQKVDDFFSSIFRPLEVFPVLWETTFADIYGSFEKNKAKTYLLFGSIRKLFKMPWTGILILTELCRTSSAFYSTTKSNQN